MLWEPAVSFTIFATHIVTLDECCIYSTVSMYLWTAGETWKVG